MKIRRTAHFDRNYTRAPQEIQQAFDKQSLLLLQNPRHPSLRAKKYDEAKRPASPVTGVFISSSKGTPTSCKKSLATRNDRAPIPPNRDSHTRDLADLAAGLGGMIETCRRLWPRCSGSAGGSNVRVVRPTESSIVPAGPISARIALRTPDPHRRFGRRQRTH
jgi:hypothetical protein